MRTILAFCTLALAFGLANSPPSTFGASKADENRGELSEKDYQFALSAARRSVMEMKAGELAKVKAADPGIKQFGQKMILVHGKALDELKAIVAEKGATLPVELEGGQEVLVNRLQNLTGQDFDKAYVEELIADQKKDLKQHEETLPKLKDGDLRDFATRTAALVAQHLIEIQQMGPRISKR